MALRVRQPGLFSPSTAVSVTLAATEAPDVAAIVLRQQWSVTLAATETPDVAAVSLSYAAPGQNLTLAATEAPDVAAINLRQEWAVTLAATEASDVAAVSLTTFGPYSVTLAATEASDTAAVTLANTPPAPTSYTPQAQGGGKRGGAKVKTTFTEDELRKIYRKSKGLPTEDAPKPIAPSPKPVVVAPKPVAPPPPIKPRTIEQRLDDIEDLLHLLVSLAIQSDEDDET